MGSHAKVRTWTGADYIVVTPVGELDFYSSPDFRQEVDAALATPGCTLVCCDLSEVEFMDSAALGELVRARRACLKAEMRFCLVGAAGTTRRILRWTQLDAVIPSYSTLGEALLTLGRS
jgi:anti-anti-sigma factor